MKWALFLGLLIVFEFLADILAKEWSIKKVWAFAVGSLLAYLVANSFWLFALKNGSGLARGSVIFSLVSGVLALFLGLIIYKEQLTRIQITGLLLGLVAIGLIFWED